MEFDLVTIQTYQVYGFLIVAGFCVFLLYGYIFYIYSNEKKGVVNYEKYGNIAIDDSIDSAPLETMTAKEKYLNKEKKNV